MEKRKLISIDEGKCDGCGLCVLNCAEGAIRIIDGKARLVNDVFCDGLGACLGHCPKDAIKLEEREAMPFDEKKAANNISWQGGCPGSRLMDFGAESCSEAEAPRDAVSELTHWPIQLHLVNPDAPYFKNADIVVAADCVPFSFAGFHERFLKGKKLLVFCPKLDDSNDAYAGKLSAIIKNNRVKSVTVVHMEVPCCLGTLAIVEAAVKNSGKTPVVKEYNISLHGGIL